MYLSTECDMQAVDAFPACQFVICRRLECHCVESLVRRRLQCENEHVFSIVGCELLVLRLVAYASVCI